MNLMGIKPITTPSTMLLQGNEVPFKLEYQIFGTKKKKTRKLFSGYQSLEDKTIPLEIFNNETISARNMFDVEKNRAQRQGIWSWKAWPDSLSHLIIQIYTTLNFSCMLKKKHKIPLSWTIPTIYRIPRQHQIFISSIFCSNPPAPLSKMHYRINLSRIFHVIHSKHISLF